MRCLLLLLLLHILGASRSYLCDSVVSCLHYITVNTRELAAGVGREV